MPFLPPDLDKFIDNHAFASKYLDEVRDKWSRVSRILVVVDGAIGITPGSATFCISKAVAAVHGFRAGLASIEITVANRNGVPDHNPHATHLEFAYTGFRFDQGGTRPILDGFDQVWCFGHSPTDADLDDAMSNNVSLDVLASQAKFHPLSHAELKALTRWMNKGGGVFATGDHSVLGASMCKDIPRVNTMRRWSIAQGVPTENGVTRFSSLQPATPGQRAGTEAIADYIAESDAMPQPIECVAEGFVVTGHGSRIIPHPILSHPTLGLIDVLPDHMHEGSCYDPHEFSWQQSGSLGQAKYIFGGGEVQGLHYPAVGSYRPDPKVIAWGQTLASPPLMFRDGPQPQRKVPLIVVYDGQEIGLGRVVVDSTWHHWFDMNLEGLEAAADQSPYQKILRYYLNVAIWLASPFWRASMTMGGLKAGQFDFFGLEGAKRQADPERLGLEVLAFQLANVGSDWIGELANDAIARVDPRRPWRVKPGEKAGLGRPSEERVRAVVLGELVKELYADRGAAMEELARKGKIGKPRSLPQEPLDVAVAAARRGLALVAREWRTQLEESRKQLEEMSVYVQDIAPPTPAGATEPVSGLLTADP
jgi:hypothetical protein